MHARVQTQGEAPVTATTPAISLYHLFQFQSHYRATRAISFPGIFIPPDNPFRTTPASIFYVSPFY